MIRRMLKVEEIKKMLEPARGMDFEVFLHTIYNQHDYAGSFDTWGNLKGLCDEPYQAWLYTDDPDYDMDAVPENIREDMDYIMEHPDELWWWFVDPSDQAAELEDTIESLKKVVKALYDYAHDN